MYIFIVIFYEMQVIFMKSLKIKAWSAQFLYQQVVLNFRCNFMHHGFSVTLDTVF